MIGEILHVIDSKGNFQRVEIVTKANHRGATATMVITTEEEEKLQALEFEDRVPTLLKWRASGVY